MTHRVGTFVDDSACIRCGEPADVPGRCALRCRDCLFDAVETLPT